MVVPRIEKHTIEKEIENKKTEVMISITTTYKKKTTKDCCNSAREEG